MINPGKSVLSRYKAEIKSVGKYSQLWKHKIRSGDVLKRINGQIITDLIDYQYAIADEDLLMEFEKANGKKIEIEIFLEPGEDPGIEFHEPVFDTIKTCRNNCIFCFIDQLPKGMRSTLYLKDDDYRLSFLYGNFITLTHIDEEALERIRTMYLSPLYLSIHTTDPRLRKNIMGCAKLENIKKQIEELLSYGIYLHLQIVLIPGLNDGFQLQKTLEDLTDYYPQVQSVGIVPVRLTKYSKKSEYFPYDPFSAKDALQARNITEAFQRKMRKRYSETVIYLSDEIYLMTGGDFPDDSHYDDYPQYENGIGMVRSLYSEVKEMKHNIPSELDRVKEFKIITGELSYHVIKGIIDDLNRRVKNLKIQLIPIKNNFFMGDVTCTGLICGCDVIEQINKLFRLEKEHQTLLIPDVMLKDELFLDNISLENVENETGFSVLSLKTSFEGLLEAINNY